MKPRKTGVKPEDDELAGLRGVRPYFRREAGDLGSYDHVMIL